MASGKETYYRKRGYSRVHVKTWTIHLEKDGFVPCSFQNCKFMAFNIVEIKNHYNTCKGEVFQAPYECVYCKGLTEHADKLEEHILRFHGHSTSTADSKNVYNNIDTKRSKEPDEELFSIINEKSEISKVIIYSWDVSKEIYGYIKCPDCSLISETVEEMKSHIFNCGKNPSAFAYECHKCNGKVTSQINLNHHMVECHSDSVLDDTFIENYSNFWKEQIDSHGFARCSNRCKFVHIDCSKLKQHFKASCSKEAGCHPVMYCDNKSCSVWSTSNLALVKHQQFEHEGKTSGSKDAKCEMNSKKKIDKHICKNNSERNLTSRISESFSPKKEVTMMDSQVEGKCIDTEKRTKSRENATVGRSSLETKVPSSNPDALKNIHGLEDESNTKLSASLKSTNMILQHPKEVREEILKNDDLYQLQTPSDADNEITIDDPLACESEDQILFVKQNDYSRLEDGAFNKMKEEIVSEEDDDTNSIYSNTSASPGIKLIVENTIKCYSRMAEISKQNHSKQEHVTNPMNEPNGENIKERIESQIKRYDKNGDSPINMFSSRQRTYSSTKNIGKYNKKYSSSTENEIKPKLCDSVMLVRKDSSTLGDKKNDDVSKVTEISSSVCSTSSLSATPNCDNTGENLVKNILEFKINTSKKQLLYSCGKSNNTRNRNQLEVEDVCKDKLTEDASGGDESLNSQVDVSPPQENEPFNTCSHEKVHLLNKNKRGRPKKIIMDVEKDLVKNKSVTPQKRGRSERLRKMSSGLEPDLQGEIHNVSGKDIQEKSGLARNERFKTVNSDLNDSVQTALVKNYHSDSSLLVQKQKEALKMSGSSAEIAPKSKDESPTIQKKRGRPRKIRSGISVDENSQEVKLSILHSQEIVQSSEEKSVDLIAQIETATSKEMAGELGDCLQLESCQLKYDNIQDGEPVVTSREQTRLSITQEETPDTQLNRKRRGRSRTISNNIGMNLDESSTSNSGKIQQERETCEDKEEVHSEALKPSCPDPEEGFKTRNNEGSMNYEHGSPTQICSSTSHEHSANVKSIPKKRGRPKKICLDSVELSKEFVPNLTLQEEEENFKDGIIEVGKTWQKSEEDDIDKGRLNENSSDTKYNPIELENTSSLLENSNKISQMIERRQRRIRKISLSLHEDSTSIPKKRGRPKKISLDSLSKSEKVVPTLNSQEEEETFSNVVVEERKNVVECEPKKSEGRKIYKRRSIAKSSATKYHEIELGKTSASIENSDNNAQIIEKKQMGTKKMSFSREDHTSIPKKRGRPRKNSLDPTLSVQEEKQPESACSIINNNLDVIETTSTAQIVSPNIEVKARKKRGKSQKMCSRLEEEVLRGSEQEEIEKQIINNQEEVDNTILEREKLEHITEIPEAVSSDHTQISEEISTASSFPNIQKKLGRSKRRKLGQDETLKSFDEACRPTQIENRKQSLDSTHQNSKMKDSTDYVEHSFDEHPHIDSCEKSTTNVVEETSIIPIAPMKRGQKPGRPRKSVPVPVLIEPNIDIESMANRDLDKSPNSNVSEPKKTADYFAEQSNLDDDESVPEIGSVSVISGKPDETPASSITDKNPKKKLGRPRKRSAINASENDQEMHTEENVPSKRKRTSSKPFKRSSYVLYKSDLEETLGNDGEENPSKTLKRRLGRGKKMSATALDFSVDAENLNTSLETKQNLCSTPRRPARSISKPKKYRGFVQESLIESCRRTSSNSDNSAHDTQDKEWQLSDSVENVEIDPLDKNENHSPVESPKPSKAISGKKKNMPPRRAVQLITCAICKKTMTRSQFETHAAEHNYFCWIEGDTPYDFEKEDDIHRHFFVIRRFKSFKGFKCDKCGAVKKSSVGYLSHKSMCGASQVEKENLKVCCPVCKRFMLPSSLKVHMGTDHRPTTKLPIQQEAVVTDSSNKRAAATRAGLNFEDELDAMESEEAKEQQVRKWYCSKKKDHTNLNGEGEELDLEINSELMCRQPTCSFKTDDLDTLQAHHTTCSKLNRDYECRICGIRVKEILDIKHHILTNHAQVIENDHSDFELGEESEQDEDFHHQENKNPSQPSLVHVRPRFVADEAQRTGLNFIYRHMQRNHDRLQANFQDSSLYKEHLAVPNGFLNEDDLLHYLPKTQESMRISTGTEHWEQLKLMECRTIEDSCCVFVGGPVWAMEWCPTSLGDDHQWLAVSCHPDMDAVYSMGDVHSHNNLIQIWDFGPLNLCSSVLPSPTLSIGIAHSQGTAWDVGWCPEGCHQPDSGRLGLLAVAFSSGIAHIYSVPLVTTQRGKPFYKLTPVIELTPPYDEPVQCVRITWWSDSPFNVVAVGFIDGTIALYNITTSSLLLRDGIKIHPYKVFTAHTESITGLQFIPNKTGDILMSSSLDKTLKFWNLLDTSAPISTCRKITPIRDAMWLNNWLCAVSVNDDGYTNGMSHLHLNNFRDLFYLQTVPWIPVDNTQWSVTASEWSNSIAMGSETGEIRIVYPHQLFSIDKSTKRASVHATTRTTLKKLRSEGEQEQEEGELDTSGPSNYKDAAENYGLVFTENQGATENPGKEKSATKCLFPVKSINKISFNPNRQAFTYLAIGYQCGVVRVIRDKHFDYAKAEMKNFADSLLMR